MLKFRLKERPDRLDWLGDVSDVFSVSFARSIIDSSTLAVTGLETRWNNWVPIKVNILI